MDKRRVFAGVFVLTLSILVLELSLTRIFSATMYYHYAFMAISVALFGSGASGVAVYLLQRRMKQDRTAEWLTVSSLLFAIGTLFALYVVLRFPLTLETGSENTYRLIKVYSASILPFFFGGSVVTIAITRLAKHIGRLYLWDLAGAAAGCLLLIPLLNVLGGINTVLLVSVLGVVGAVVFSGSARQTYFAAAFLLLLGTGGLLLYNIWTNRFDIRMAKGFEQQNVLFSKWNSFSRITVAGALGGSGLSIEIDADAATMITRNASDVRRHSYQRSRIESLAYHLKDPGNVLIIGPGGGNDVMTARVFGMRRITAVEVNPIIARDVMSAEPFRSFSGAIYQQPDVELVVDEGRSFIRRSREQYDIIQATMVDTWAATAAGAFALTENNLYTVEAFTDYVNHLTDDGVLTMTRWYFEPPDQLLRLLSLTRAMMGELGVSNPDRHVVLVREAQQPYGRAPATYLFKKSEFTVEEVQRVEAVARSAGFLVLYSPLTRPNNVFTRIMEAGDPAAVWDSFETNVEPTFDNNPFFFNSLRLSNLASALGGATEWQKTNLGTFVLFLLLGITAVLVTLFILGPLVVARGRVLAGGIGSKLRFLLYFACLGAGFIIVEVAMIQKFILFLGHPVYSLVVVLFTLLAFSGMGSWLTGRFAEPRIQSILAKLLIAIVGLVIVYIALLGPLFYGLVHLPQALRIILAVVLLGPLAFLMGMPMPLGIRILSQRIPEIIPWAWGVNGATSVMGSVGALAIAILTGFNQALVVGASLYLIAAVLISRNVKITAENAAKRRIEAQAAT